MDNQIYNFYSAIQPNYMQHLKDFLITLKINKEQDAIYKYIIAIDDDNLQQYAKELSFLASEDFILCLQSSKKVQPLIKHKIKHYSLFLKCLLPDICPDLDKILFLDIDMLVLKRGIEKFYDTDISNYYLAACWDQQDGRDTNPEKIQCKTKNYFNAGVMLFNLKKLRQSEDYKHLRDIIYGSWPAELTLTEFPEQTILNFIYKDNVLICSPLYNNFISMVNIYSQDVYMNLWKKWGYDNPLNSINDTIILHFAGPKPWNDMDQNKKQIYFLYPLMKNLYEDIKKQIKY